jgi:hypothetical protein
MLFLTQPIFNYSCTTTIIILGTPDSIAILQVDNMNPSLYDVFTDRLVQSDLTNLHASVLDKIADKERELDK